MNLRTIKIHVTRKLIDEFKREAKEAFPKETFAYLLGRDAGTEVEIEELFVPLDVDEWCTSNSVIISEAWLPAARRQATYHGLKVVGDIHSHPFRHEDMGNMKADCAPSAGDIDEGLPYISAVCAIKETNTKRLIAQVRFWGPMFPVEEHIN